MSDSPSDQIERALKAIEELVHKDEVLVSKGFWQDALENQSRLETLVSELPALLGKLPPKGIISNDMRARVTQLIRIQEANKASAGQRQAQLGNELHRSEETRGKLNHVRPAYTNPFKAAWRDHQTYRLDSKG